MCLSGYSGYDEVVNRGLNRNCVGQNWVEVEVRGENMRMSVCGQHCDVLCIEE
jgi:hypothetical protein